MKGTFNVHFTFKEKDDKLLDFLIDWYVRRGMDCTAGVGGDGTGSADVNKKYLAAFCMIDKIVVTAVRWDKTGVTAWRPKRRKIIPFRNSAKSHSRQKLSKN